MSAFAIAAMIACGGGNGSSPADDAGDVDGSIGQAGGGAAGPGGAPTCHTDADCAAAMPATAPPNCATGKCDVVQGVCAFTAIDADHDGHPAANCSAAGGAVTVTTGDDCDDSNPALFPGHPVACAPPIDGGAPPDAGAPNTILCRQGQISCLPDGTRSACTGAVICTNQACTANGTCAGSCAPGHTQCASTANGVQTCQADGSWGSPVSCGNKACVAPGTCGGQCAPTQTRCSPTANVVQTCDQNGNWVDSTACVHKTCSGGQCAGVCAPGEVDTASSAPNGACHGDCQSFTRSCGANGNWGACSGTPVNKHACHVAGDVACPGTGCSDADCSGSTTKSCAPCASVSCGQSCAVPSGCAMNGDPACAGGSACPGAVCSGGPTSKSCGICPNAGCGAACTVQCPNNWSYNPSSGHCEATNKARFSFGASDPTGTNVGQPVTIPANTTSASTMASGFTVHMSQLTSGTGSCCSTDHSTPVLRIWCGGNSWDVFGSDFHGNVTNSYSCAPNDTITFYHMNGQGTCCCGCARYVDVVATTGVATCQTSQ